MVGLPPRHPKLGDYMEHLNQEVLNFIKAKLISSEVTTTGDIETIYKANFDNGKMIEGKSIRPIDGFDQEEANNAAYENAINTIYDGVAFALNKV